MDIKYQVENLDIKQNIAAKRILVIIVQKKMKKIKIIIYQLTSSQNLNLVIKIKMFFIYQPLFSIT